MGMFDNIRKKAEKAVDEHGDKIAQGIDKAGGMASKKTGGKHDTHIAKGSTAAKDALDKLDGKNDDIPDARPSTGGTPPGSGTPRH
ncbi:MAG TPA: antitoxin [Actinomycetes bacterium]|nr:antitoxin [Actinomycetes bacterium]